MNQCEPFLVSDFVMVLYKTNVDDCSIDVII